MNTFYGPVTEYYLPYWFVGLLVAYAISFWLVKTKKLSLLNQRRFWNAFLGIAFLKTAILGIVLVFKAQYGLQTPAFLDVKFWHVEAGLAFAVIAIFHILWHLTYFKMYFKK